MLVIFLILFLLFLFFLHGYKAFENKVDPSLEKEPPYGPFKEGLENVDPFPANIKKEVSYQNYPEDPLMLAKQNAGNIEYLKTQVDDLSKFKQKVIDMDTTLNNVNMNVAVLTQQQAAYAKAIDSSPISVN